MRISSIIISASLLMLAACGADTEGEGGAPADTTAAAAAAAAAAAEGRVDPRTLQYSPDLGIDFPRFQVLPSGLFYRDELVGSGAEAVAGMTITAHYTGYHPDGRSFDSSVGGEPFTVAIGAGQVIDGWDQGIPGMRVGGRRILVIPPHLGYGAEGAGGGVIPPNAVLVFRVELLGVSR